MVKLSQQLDVRKTRTQRVVEQRQRETGRQQSKQEFENLKSQAEQIRKQRFSNISSLNQYTTEYNKLPSKLKPFFKKPDDLKDSETFKEIEQANVEEQARQRELEKQQERLQELKVAEKLYRRAKQGKNPFLSQQPKRIQEYYRLMEKAERETGTPVYFVSQAESLLKKRITTLQGQKREIEQTETFLEYEKAFEKLDPELKQYYKSPKKVKQEIIAEQDLPEKKFYITDRQLQEIERNKDLSKIPRRETISNIETQPNFIKDIEKKEIAPLSVLKDVGKFATVSLGTITDVNKFILSPIPDVPFPTITLGQIGKTTKFFIPPNLRRKTNIITSISGIKKYSDIEIDLTEGAREFQQPAQQKLAFEKQREISQLENIQDIENRREAEFQQQFEVRYFGKVASGELTQEEAQEEFLKSDTAKAIIEKYEKEIEQERREQPSLRRFGLGSKYLGIQATTLPFKAFETPKNVLITSGSLLALQKIPTTIPKSVLNTANVGFFASGTAKIIDPLSSPEDIASGVITAGISGAVLARQGIRFLTRPEIVYKQPFKTPRVVSVKRSDVIAKDVIKKSSGGVQKYTEIPKQRTLQLQISGRKPFFTTRLRKLLGFKPIDISSRARPVIKIEGLRGDFSYKPTTTYQKYYNKLIKYGYSPSQARSSLRVTPSRIINVDIQGKITPVKKFYFGKLRNVYEGKLITKISQPVKFDKLTGMNTRGASTKIEATTFQRFPITIRNKKLLVELSQKRFFNKVISKSTFKGIEFEKSILGGESFNIGKTNFPVQKTNLFTAFTKADTKIIFGSRLSPTGLDRARTFLVSGKNIKPTTRIFEIPKSTKGSGININQIDKNIRGNINKNQVNQIKNLIRDTGAGTGTSNINLQNIPKSQTEQILRQVNIKDPIITPTPSPAPLTTTTTTTTTTTAQLSNLNVAGLTANVLASQLKTETKLDNKELLKNIIIERNLEKNLEKQADLQKQQPAQRTAFRTIQSPKSTTKTTTSPIIAPIIPSITEPRVNTPKLIQPQITTPPFFLLEQKGRKQKGKRKTKKRDVFALLPDFTTRILGLKPKSLTENQAQKEVKKILTGLEIRRGARLIR